MNKIIKDRLPEIKQICEKLGVKSLYLFGSAEKEMFNKNSDFDFLIEFKQSLSIEEYTDNYFTIHYKLRELLKREIDLVTQNSLSNPFFIKSIEQNKKLLYGA